MIENNNIKKEEKKQRKDSDGKQNKYQKVHNKPERGGRVRAESLAFRNSHRLEVCGALDAVHVTTKRGTSK